MRDMTTIPHMKLVHRAAQGLDGKLVLATYGENPETGESITPKVEHFAIGDYEAMARRAAELSKETHRNVYMPLAVLKTGIPSRGKLDDYTHILGVCADFDDSNASDYLSRLPLPPGLVIGSSKGRYQAVYLFSTPIDTKLQPNRLPKRYRRALDAMVAAKTLSTFGVLLGA